MSEIIKKIISNRWFLSFITVLITGVIFKFMSKERKEETTKDLDTVVFRVKKNAKLLIYIACFLFIVVLPIATFKPIFYEDKGELLIVNLIFISFSIFLFIATKSEMVYNDGVFKWKTIFGKSKIYKLDDVVRAKYQEGNGFATIVLYNKDKKKLEFSSYHTNFDWVLKEIKIRNIEIYNK